MAEKRKKEIVTFYSTNNGNQFRIVNEKEKPRFIEKDSFEAEFEKRRVRAGEREIIHRRKNVDGSIEEQIYKERFEKKDGSKKK